MAFSTSLLEPLAGWWPALLDDLERGTFTAPSDPGVHSKRLPLPLRNPRRAAALRAGGGPAPERIWPHLAAISCWTDAAARGPSQQLAEIFPQARVVGKGLLSTEGVVSIPWPEAEAPALALTAHFLEFVDESGGVHAAWDLSRNACYSVLLTTGGGLYRYRLNDGVRVVGFHQLCPLVEFLGRDGITCDLCGEKLAEPFARDCLERVARGLGQVWRFALLAPSTLAAPPGYSLFICGQTWREAPAIASAVDAALCANVHYSHARRIGQLAMLEVVPLTGAADWAWARFQATQAGRGQRLGDIKPAALDSRAGWGV